MIYPGVGRTRRLELSAAVCTRDRPEELRRALESLARQQPPLSEVLVIDNAPRDARTRELVEREFPGFRYLEEPVPGLDFARNRALSAALGDMVAFLDDDAVAEPGWAAALLRPFQEDLRVAAVTGRVLPLALETEGQRAFEANGGFSRGDRQVRLPRDAQGLLHGPMVRGTAPLIAWAVSVGSGCSLAVHRWRMLSLGGFDEALDLGPALPGGGDHDALWRLLDDGWTLVYEPAALARHEHRRDLGAAFDQIVGHQRALVAFLTKSFLKARRRRLEILAFLLWRLVEPVVRLLRPGDPLPARVRLRMLAHCWKGLGAYRAARRIAQERRRAILAPRTVTP